MTEPTEEGPVLRGVLDASDGPSLIAGGYLAARGTESGETLHRGGTKPLSGPAQKQTPPPPPTGSGGVATQKNNSKSD